MTDTSHWKITLRRTPASARRLSWPLASALSLTLCFAPSLAHSAEEEQSNNLQLNQNQSATPSSIDLNSTTPNEALADGTFSQENRYNLLLPGETDVRKLLPSSGEIMPPPYGANLFAGGYETERSNGTLDNYPIAPGDKLNIWIWGSANYSNVATVDNQGNIFIPDVGPIQVMDVKASQINQFVSEKIRQVYTKNVNVYVNLLTATPITVYLSGPVIRPGQYAGMSSDSVLYYLKRAGGIDSERGSYRDVRVIRNGETIAQIDLYQFMKNGQMPKINFKSGDTILVEPQKAAITVSGGVRNPFRFELNGEQALGSALADLSLPLPKVSHVAVTGNRASGPFSRYMSYQKFSQFTLRDGDKVLFNDDLHPQVIDVEVGGSYLGPSYFAITKQARLHDVLNAIPVDKNLADIGSVYILRKSVAERQQKLLEESLDRLERSVFTGPASSTGEASIRSQEAQMVLQFTDRARKVKALGKVVVADHGKVSNILLEQGDKIVIPNKTDLVQVAGEVLMPQAVVYNQDATIDDYVAWAGGFSDRAEDKRIAVVRANGLVEFEPKEPVRKGDQILVLPKVDSKTMQSIKDITQVIYQIAVAANVAT